MATSTSRANSNLANNQHNQKFMRVRHSPRAFNNAETRTLALNELRLPPMPRFLRRRPRFRDPRITRYACTRDADVKDEKGYSKWRLRIVTSAFRRSGAPRERSLKSECSALTRDPTIFSLSAFNCSVKITRVIRTTCTMGYNVLERSAPRD